MLSSAVMVDLMMIEDVFAKYIDEIHDTVYKGHGQVCRIRCAEHTAVVTF